MWLIVDIWQSDLNGDENCSYDIQISVPITIILILLAWNNDKHFIR